MFKKFCWVAREKPFVHLYDNLSSHGPPLKKFNMVPKNSDIKRCIFYVKMYPSYKEITQFIKSNGGSTLYEIIVNFEQQGDSNIFVPKPGCKKKQYCLVVGVNNDFFIYLQKFIKHEFVKVQLNNLACLNPTIGLTNRYNIQGPGEFLPIFLTVS